MALYCCCTSAELTPGCWLLVSSTSLRSKVSKTKAANLKSCTLSTFSSDSFLSNKKPGGLVIVGVNAPGGRLALPPLGQKSRPCHQNCLITHTPTKSHPQSHIPTEKITPTPTKSGSRHTHIYKLINTVTYTESIIPYSKLL